MRVKVENVKNQKETGTILGVKDEVGKTEIYKLDEEENIVLYAEERYRKKFKHKEIKDALAKNKKIITTANSKEETRKLKEMGIEAKAEVRILSLNEEKGNCQIDLLGEGSKEEIETVICSKETNEYIASKMKEAIEKILENKEGPMSVEEDGLKRMFGKLPTSLKEKGRKEIEKEFKSIDGVLLIVTTEGVEKEVVKFAMTMLWEMLHNKGKEEQLIVEEENCYTKYFAKNKTGRYEIIASNESELELPEVIEIYCWSKYTLVKENNQEGKLMMLNMPTSKEMFGDCDGD